MSVLGIDFDGVLHDAARPVPGRRMGPPIEGAQAAMRTLQARGHELVIFTVRGAQDRRQHVEEWLRFYDIPFTRVTNLKESFDAIVDDHAIRFVTWGQTLRDIR